MEHTGVSIREADSSQSRPADDALINSLARDMVNPHPGKLMSFEEAPDNKVTRMGLVTVHGVSNVPRGVWNAVVHDVRNPLETATTVGSAAAMAFVLKTALPEGGLAGKVAGAAMGAYFTFKAAEPVIDSYKKAARASTLSQLNAASRQFGDAGGSYIVNSAVAAVGYKIGSSLTDRWLTSESMDGFADAKAKFYDRAGELSSRITDNIGLTTPHNAGLPGQDGVAATRVRLEGSERRAPEGVLKGDVDPSQSMEVTVMLKSKGSDLRMDRTLARISQGRQAPLSDAEFAEKFGSRPESLQAVSKFAEEYGIKVSESDLASGRVVLKGGAGQFSDAFETKLAEYESSGVKYRGRKGSLSIPRELSPHIGSVLGTDNRPQARANIVRLMAPEGPAPTPPGEPPKDGPTPEPNGKKVKGFMPNEVADAYNFPKDATGKGQGVAVIELGGGLDQADNAKYYQDHKLPQPKINLIEVGGAKNKPGYNSQADSEVALDSQVIGVVAPEATQNIIFAPNSDKGFVDAITRGTFAQAGEVANRSISISWGAPEEAWTQQAKDGMGEAFKKAALKGISIFAASGDDGALDRARSGKWQVDFPASNPEVTGTGGSRLVLTDGLRTETAWNNHRENDASGGGISQVYQLPDFQKDAKVPVHATTGQPGRGVPDIAGNADPLSGYIIRVDGKETVTGGTSAVAPLYSALMMKINESMGRSVGNLNPWFYKNTSIFNDIVEGDNNAYKAGPGWDAVTGLGSIDGTKMLNALRANPGIAPNFGEFKYVGPAQFVAPVPIGQDSGRK
jgi:kumamolisin